jgi:precorrin-6B methylase 2
MSSITNDKEWATRHLSEGESWIESYWTTWDHPHRRFLLSRIAKFAPMRSVLEVGCLCGPNLYGIAKRFPHAEIRGIDINPLAVERGNEWFKKDGISNVKLDVGRAQDLKRFADGSFDVVLTDAVLIYITPDEIKDIIKEMLRIGKALVLNEWHLFSRWRALLLSNYYYVRMRNPQFRSRSFSLGVFVGHWARDYRALLGKFVSDERTNITKLPKGLWEDRGWQRWGAVIEAASGSCSRDAVDS